MAEYPERIADYNALIDQGFSDHEARAQVEWDVPPEPTTPDDSAMSPLNVTAEDEWCWSWDGEHFNGGPEDGKANAEAQARRENEGCDRPIYIGRKRKYESFKDNLVDTLCEQETCQADDEVGEVAESWPGTLDPAAVAEANRKIRAIMQELVGEPHFYGITDVYELDMGESDAE